ncbi:MAG TPA: Gfo/Idh/MocA family oxidoreductase [Herpetosiphonaceae bacterium]
MARRVAIIGTGWGLIHVGAFRAAGWEVAALAGREPNRTARIAAEQQIPQHTTDVATLFADPTIDVIVVATPHDVHAEHSIAAIEAGKHVLCEKPLARTVAEAEAMVRAAEARPDRVAALNFPSRFLTPFARLHSEIRAGALGRIHQVLHQSASALPRDDRNWMEASSQSLGALGEMGSHLLDLTMWLLGKQIRTVQSCCDEEDNSPNTQANVLVTFEDGGSGVISVGPGHEPGIRTRWQAVGARSTLRTIANYEPALGGWRVGPLIRIGPEGARETLDVGLVADPNIGGSDPWFAAHVATARALAAAIGGESVPALATWHDGLRVQRVMEAALESASSGQRIEL